MYPIIGFSCTIAIINVLYRESGESPQLRHDRFMRIFCGPRVSYRHDRFAFVIILLNVQTVLNLTFVIDID